MKYRCHSQSPNNPYATYYRDKGIKVCDEWCEDFWEFQRWSLAHGYQEGLTIDRIDGDGDYSPGNCRWVTAAENSKNQPKQKKRRKPRIATTPITDTQDFKSTMERLDERQKEAVKWFALGLMAVSEGRKEAAA